MWHRWIRPTGVLLLLVGCAPSRVCGDETSETIPLEDAPWHGAETKAGLFAREQEVADLRVEFLVGSEPRQITDSCGEAIEADAVLSLVWLSPAADPDRPVDKNKVDHIVVEQQKVRFVDGATTFVIDEARIAREGELLELRYEVDYSSGGSIPDSLLRAFERGKEVHQWRFVRLLPL